MKENMIDYILQRWETKNKIMHNVLSVSGAINKWLSELERKTKWEMGVVFCGTKRLEKVL